jgi:hypothetical protein
MEAAGSLESLICKDFIKFDSSMTKNVCIEIKISD